MNKTALQMKSDELRQFIPARGLSMYREKKRSTLAGLRRRAWKTAEQAADLLKKKFRYQKVVVFGSLVRGTDFTEWSDIDLAIWGIRRNDYYNAVAAVTGLSSDFEIDLTDPETCCETLRKTIQTQGIEI